MCKNNKCASGKVNAIKNSLAELFPNIASEAYGWDPKAVSYGAGVELKWKCAEGHIFKKTPNERTNLGRGCGYCSGKKVLAGFNCLRSRFPKIAKEAHGWDPSTVTHGCSKFRDFKCPLGHIYNVQVSTRTNMGSGCSYCSGKKVLPGFNCLKSRFPEIAKEAYGWNPGRYTYGSGARVNWKCSGCGEIFQNKVKARTGLGRGCKICTHQEVVKGRNDLKTLFPQVAKCAHGWDPESVFPNDKKNRQWKCKHGHIVFAAPTTRIRSFKHHGGGDGCAECSTSGFKISKPSAFYLVYRTGQFKLGKMNIGSGRIEEHRRNGWSLIEMIEASGKIVSKLEEDLLSKLESKNIPTGKKAFPFVFDGYTETWPEECLKVRTIRGLCRKLGVDLESFLAS